MKDLVDIIILNWNGWQDTIQCLESVFRNNYPNYRVILCDNASSDGSMEKIIAWTQGELVVENDGSPLFQKYCQPVISKPLSYVLYNREEAENSSAAAEVDLILIQTGENLGFAGGNNVGLIYSMQREGAAYAWLLNNDTVIHEDSLVHLVSRMKHAPAAGICGSSLIFYDNPDYRQATGGSSYYKWLGLGVTQGKVSKTEDPVDRDKVEKSLDYIIGASMLVSSPLLQKVGLMDDNYFLYYEEIDWALRAKPFFSLAYAPESLVYHKVGGSIGSHRKATQRSSLADYHLLKNRLAFTRKFYPYAVPTVILELVLEMILRLLRGQRGSAGMVLGIIFNKEN
ncbi:MAG: glycosyltransferase family 2 protein [Gammaproteobacteria bacterium]|nr:glycosyltransferase family 2 protein [Gammaproteobacteria bacterium]